MKRIFVVFLFCSSTLLSYSQKIELDSVYKVLYDFLYFNQEGIRDLLELQKGETFRDKIHVNDILDTISFDAGINPQEQIAVYHFYSIGEDHSVLFFLIKVFGNFGIYDSKNIVQLIKRLKHLKEEYPNLMTDSKFIRIIERLVEYPDIFENRFFLPIYLRHGVSYLDYYQNHIDYWQNKKPFFESK